MTKYSPRADYDDGFDVGHLRTHTKYRIATILWLILGTLPAYALLVLIVIKSIQYALVGGHRAHFDLVLLGVLGWVVFFGSLSYRPIMMCYRVIPLGIFQAINVTFLLVLSIGTFIAGGCIGIFKQPYTGLGLMFASFAYTAAIWWAIRYHLDSYQEACAERAEREDSQGRPWGEQEIDE